MFFKFLNHATAVIFPWHYHAAGLPMQDIFSIAYLLAVLSQRPKSTLSSHVRHPRSIVAMNSRKSTWMKEKNKTWRNSFILCLILILFYLSILVSSCNSCHLSMALSGGRTPHARVFSCMSYYLALTENAASATVIHSTLLWAWWKWICKCWWSNGSKSCDSRLSWVAPSLGQTSATPQCQNVWCGTSRTSAGTLNEIWNGWKNSYDSRETFPRKFKTEIKHD